MAQANRLGPNVGDPESDIDWINPWIGLDWIGSRNPHF